jgi:tRNA 2-thiouridine synthesizing protein A
MSNFDQELDARGLNCPLPILRAKKTLNAMSGGQILEIKPKHCFIQLKKI